MDNARGVAAVYRPAITLGHVRPRLYWPLVIAASALVALLTYGVASNGEDRSIDAKLAAGERVAAPVRDLPDSRGRRLDRRADCVQSLQACR